MLLRRNPILRCQLWEMEGIAPCQIVVTTWCSICGGDVQMWLVQTCSRRRLILLEDWESVYYYKLLRSGDGKDLIENTASSIYWAPPSARFVTISARCDCWQRRRAITQFALALQVAKLLPRALCKAVTPISRRQHRQITDLVRCSIQIAAVGWLEMDRCVYVLSSAPCFTLRASGNIANHDDNAGQNTRPLERAWSNMVEHAITLCVPSRLTSSEVCLSAWSRSGSRSRFVGLSGRPVAPGIAWRCHVQH
jgi:hypothetical protein